MNGNTVIEWIEDNYDLVYEIAKERYPHMSDDEIEEDDDLQYDIAMDYMF